MNAEQKHLLKELLVDLIPENCLPIGNKSLIPEFLNLAKRKYGIELEENDYWDVRNDLIDDGKIEKGRGKGGSVYRVFQERIDEGKYERELYLYRPFQKAIEKFWINDNDIGNYIIETTASQGRRDTGGNWTRPDMAVVTVKSYEFVPNKSLEVITFEIKKKEDYSVKSLFETAAHTYFAHRAYLSIHRPDDDYKQQEYQKIIKECERFSIGLITFSNPDDWRTYSIVVEAKKCNPEPKNVDLFIRNQISHQKKIALRDMLLKQ